MLNLYTQTPKTGSMQDTIDVLQGKKGTINVMSAARHSGLKAWCTAEEWGAIEGGKMRIVKGRHRGPRKVVPGYELLIGQNYVAVFATAHAASDLYTWACANGYSAETLRVNSPALRRANCARVATNDSFEVMKESIL